MMEGLGRTIKKAKVLGKIKGLHLTENGQALTHQRFVDDTMLQGIPTVKEATTYKKILNDFASASGMEVNLSKSIFFSSTVTLLFKGTSPEFWASKGRSSPLNILESP